MDRKTFIYVRAGGAIVCIITLNALVLLSYQNVDVETPKWSIYVLMLLIGALLGLDALISATPFGPSNYEHERERPTPRDDQAEDRRPDLEYVDETALEEELEERRGGR